MDPNANIEEQRKIAARIREIDSAGDYGYDANPEIEQAAVDLAELVLALDEWRRKGGFDPYLELVHLDCFGAASACGARTGKRTKDGSAVTCVDCLSRIVTGQ